MFVVNFDKRLDQKGWPAAPPPPHLFGTKYQFLRKHFGGRGPFNRANHQLSHDPWVTKSKHWHFKKSLINSKRHRWFVTNGWLPLKTILSNQIQQMSLQNLLTFQYSIGNHGHCSTVDTNWSNRSLTDRMDSMDRTDRIYLRYKLNWLYNLWCYSFKIFLLYIHSFLNIWKCVLCIFKQFVSFYLLI